MQNLERRIAQLEGKSRVYQSAAEMPNEVLLAMLSPLCGGRVPTQEELHAIAAGRFEAERKHDAKP